MDELLLFDKSVGVVGPCLTPIISSSSSSFGFECCFSNCDDFSCIPLDLDCPGGVVLKDTLRLLRGCSLAGVSVADVDEDGWLL